MIDAFRPSAAVAVALLSGACAEPLPTLEANERAALPQALANNAVARIETPHGVSLFSFLGLGAGKTWRDTSSAAYMLPPGAESWETLPDVPGSTGRLAGTAQGVGDRVYVFGGYTVAEDGAEKSIETVHAFDPVSGTYEARAPMPVPVDDAASFVYRDRYVYLVSGWHDLGNVNLVQSYDTQTDTWRQATPYPGDPVFGHAGGLVGNVLVVCDGVRIVVETHGRRRFEATDACYVGEIDGEDPARIEWHALPAHPGEPRYRMAAVGTRSGGGRIVFAGGSDNPYNYDGIGYDGKPSAGSDRVLAYSLADRLWRTLGRLPAESMDHRGLLEIDGGFALVGGMRRGQRVSDAVVWFALPD